MTVSVGMGRQSEPFERMERVWCLPVDVGRGLSTHWVPGLISIFNVMSTDIVFKNISRERAMWASDCRE